MLEREDFARIKWLMENDSKNQLDGIIKRRNTYYPKGMDKYELGLE